MLSTVIKKETRQLFSDKGFLIISLIQPIIFIIMFGSSFQSGDINHLDTIIIDDDNTLFSRYVLDATENSEFFDVVEFSGFLEEAINKLKKSQVRAVIFIPKDFERNINNTEAGEIKIYLDSSNFLTYSSLSGAQIEIAKDSLMNITNDILGELESEKNDKEKIIGEIRDIFDEVEIEAEVLEDDLNKLKNETNEDSEIGDFEKSIKKFKSGVSRSRDDLIHLQEAFETIVLTLDSMDSMNSSDAIKRDMIVTRLQEMNVDFNYSIEDTEELLDELNKIEIPEINETLTEVIEDRMKYIEDKLRDAEKKSDNVDFGFKKLEKKFLSEPIKLEEIASSGPIRYFDYLGAGILSLIVFFVCLMAPALNIITEKEKNTLYRLSTTPLSSLTLFIGKFIVFISFGFVEMAYTLLLAILIYDLRITGSIYSVVFILFLLACSAISLGLLISSKVKTMQQALVVVPLVVIPSFLISHSFFPPDIMADFMNYVAYITPMTFSNHALNAIMIKGAGLTDVIGDIIALIGFIVIPLFLFIWSYRNIKY